MSVLLFCCSAVLLSGGVDSSAIALAAADQAPGDMQAFTARFSGFRNDESRYAALAAQRAGIPVTMVDYDARDLINDLARVTWHMDAPVAKGQMLARWALIRSAAAGGAKIILEGQGADELLGGYPDRYARAYLGSELDQPQIGALAMMLPWAGIAAAAYARRLLLRSLGVVPVTAEQNHPSRLLSRRLQAAPPYGIPPAPAISARFTDRLAERLWQDHAHLLLPYLLHFGDAISMGNAMESRLPFLDHRLVEFAFALPFRWKIRNGEFKVVLRRALAAELSPETLARKLKVGFATPVGEWLTRAWTSDVIPLLSSLRLRQRDIFDNKALARLSTGFEAHGHAPLMVFRCAAIELWFQQFIDGDGFHASGR